MAAALAGPRLPRFDIEGEAVERELALTDWEPAAAVVADGVALAPLLDDLTVAIEDGASLLVTGPRTEVSAGAAGAQRPARARRVAAQGARQGAARPGRRRARPRRVRRPARPADPAAALRAALAERPALLAVDGLDAAGPDARALLDDVPHTLLLGTTADDDPFPAAQRLALDPAHPLTKIEVPA